MTIEYREGEPEDNNFIINSWIKSYRKYSSVSNDVYYVEQEKLIKSILKRNWTSVNIACNPEDYGQIYGYIVTDAAAVPIVHYCFVKQVFRGMGIATHLFHDAFPESVDVFITSHDTMLDKDKFAGRQKIFSPYKAFGDYK